MGGGVGFRHLHPTYSTSDRSATGEEIVIPVHCSHCSLKVSSIISSLLDYD